jgi:hypothetical protein
MIELNRASRAVFAVQGAERSALVKNARPDHGQSNDGGAALDGSVVQYSKSVLLMIGFHKNSQKLNTQKINVAAILNRLVNSILFVQNQAKHA